jgi:cell division protease FtsH
MLGGRAAESLIFDTISTGASDDIAKATQVARAMVTRFGMSKLGPINLDSERRMMYEPSEVSPEMQAKIDEEVKRIMDKAYEDALSVLKGLKTKLDKVAEELLKKETIEAEDFVTLVGAKNLPKDKVEKIEKEG